MTWADFYLICFAVGLAFSFLAFLAGGVRWHLHLPHLPHAAHIPAGRVAVKGGGGGQVSPFNFVSFTAFLAWFGGTGYLLTRVWTVWFVMGLAIALLSGIAGAGIIYLFLTKVLMSAEENLDPGEFSMAGVLGRISVPIRAGGTGEIVYSQGGTRQTCGARAEDGGMIEKGSEVMVVRYEKGIAYVRLWDEVAELREQTREA